MATISRYGSVVQLVPPTAVSPLVPRWRPSDSSAISCGACGLTVRATRCRACERGLCLPARCPGCGSGLRGDRRCSDCGAYRKDALAA